MSNQDDNHARILYTGRGSDRRTYTIARPVLSVHVVPSGPQKGWYGMIVTGTNEKGENTIVELRAFPTLGEAFTTFNALASGQITYDDVKDFDPNGSKEKQRFGAKSS
jgi:hypothetical protein